MRSDLSVDTSCQSFPPISPRFCVATSIAACMMSGRSATPASCWWSSQREQCTWSRDPSWRSKYTRFQCGSSWHWKIFTVGGDHLNFLSWQMRWFIKRLIDTRTGRLEQASCHMPSPCVFIEQHTEFGSCRLHMGWIASQEIQMTMTNIQG